MTQEIKMYYGPDMTQEEKYVPAPRGDARADFEQRTKEIVESEDEDLKKAWELHKTFGPQPK